MRRKVWIYCVTAAAGVLLHFLYDWLPLPVIGLFAPVNESVWEHLKLLFWPFVAASFALTRGAAQPQRAWGACFAALLAMPAALLGAYYTLTTGFAVGGEVFPIALYFLALALGFCLQGKLEKLLWAELWAGVLLMAVSIYAACLVIFSIAAPHLPIFMAA